MKRKIGKIMIVLIIGLAFGLFFTQKINAKTEQYLIRKLTWSGCEATAKTQTRSDKEYFAYLPTATIFIYNSSGVCIGSSSQTAPYCYNTAQAPASHSDVTYARGYHYITDGINPVGFTYEDRDKGVPMN